MPKRQAAKPVGGLGMLIYQGAAAAKLYTGLDMPVEEVNGKIFPKIKCFKNKESQKFEEKREEMNQKKY